VTHLTAHQSVLVFTTPGELRLIADSLEEEGQRGLWNVSPPASRTRIKGRVEVFFRLPTHNPALDPR
jgi:hypothetical protein